MAPLLLFSGLVQVIGFATTTVIGYMLGVAISRPAYAVVAEKLFGINPMSHHNKQYCSKYMMLEQNKMVLRGVIPIHTWQKYLIGNNFHLLYERFWILRQKQAILM